MFYFNYINQEQIPNFLLDECIFATKNTPDLFIKEGELKDLDFYCYDLPDNVINWVVENFHFTKSLPKWCFKVQVLKHRIPIHKDRNRTLALNYIINTGGKDVYTAWYDDDKILIQKEKLEQSKWHIINTEIYHGVHNIQQGHERIAISIDLFHKIKN